MSTPKPEFPITLSEPFQKAFPITSAMARDVLNNEEITEEIDETVFLPSWRAELIAFDQLHDSRKDLLEACKALLKYVSFTGCDLTFASELRATGIALAEKAIQKAEGRV